MRFALLFVLSITTQAQNQYLSIVPVKAPPESEFTVYAACLAVQNAAGASGMEARIASEQPRVANASLLKDDPAVAIFDFVLFVSVDPASQGIMLDGVSVKEGVSVLKSIRMSPKSSESLDAFHERMVVDLFKRAGWKNDAGLLSSVKWTSGRDAYEAFCRARFNERSLPDSAEALYRRALSLDPAMIEAAVCLAEWLSAANKTTDAVNVLSPFGSNAKALRTIGDVYFDHANDLRAARRAYQDALKINPRDDHALTQLGVISWIEKNNDLARQYANQALSVDNDYAPALNILGNYAMAAGDTSSAEKYYERAAVSDRFEKIARKNLARLNEERGRLDEARRLHNEILMGHPDDANTLMALANLEYHGGDRKDACLHYVMGVLYRPELESASNNPVQILQFVTKQRSDLTPLREIVVEWEDALLAGELPESMQMMVHASIGYVRVTYLGMPSEALTDLQLAVAWNPELFRLHWLLGDASFQLGRYPKALGYYDYCTQRAGDSYSYARVHLSLGKTLLRMKRYEEAQLAILKSVRINPNAESYLYYALALRGLQQYEAAVAQIEKALRVYPAYLEGHLEIGRTYMMAHRYDRAMDYYHRTIELDSTYYPARVALSELYLTLERFEDAEKEIRTAIDLAGDKTSPSLFSTLGNIYLAQKRYPDAQSWFMRHWERDSTDADLAYKVAVTFGGSGRLQPALVWLEKAFKMQFTDFADVRRRKAFKAFRENADFAKLVGQYEEAFQRETVKRLKN